MRQPHRAFTLLEMLVTLGMAATLAVLAAAAGRQWLLEARMVGAVNGVVHAIHLARAAALAEAREVVLCRSVDGAQCAPAGDWSSGWLVFVNHDGDEPAMVDAGERILAASGRLPLASIRSNRRAYTLRPHALRATNGTLVFCDERGDANARALILSYSGRPRLSRRAADGGALQCAG